jgi:hypothetical protein
MPITLGCPSCGKRFRAREESSGKKVKCPFCQAAVPVPSSDEAQHAGAPTEVVPTSPPAPATPASPYLSMHPPAVSRPGHAGTPTAPVPAASPDAWGAEPQQKPESPARPAAPPILKEEPLAFAPIPSSPGARLLPPPSLPKRPAKPAKSPEEQAVAAWKKVRGGLFWVLFGLFWFALISIVPVAKIVYERSAQSLPKGDGAEWVKIEGAINTPGPDAVQLSKEDLVDLAVYGLPILIGGLCLSFGRVTAGAAPRNSGAKGLFAFSGLITLLALAGLVTWVVCNRVAYREYANYGLWTARIGVFLGEIWFLQALTAAGATLRRPSAVRTIGLFTLVAGLGVAVYFVGWDLYVEKLGPTIGRPKTVEAGSDWAFYEAAARLLGCMVLIGTYWRAVRGVRIAIKEHVEE